MNQSSIYAITASTSYLSQTNVANITNSTIIAGGSGITNGISYKTMLKMDFVTTTYALFYASLQQPRTNAIGMNFSSKGYFAGGVNHVSASSSDDVYHKDIEYIEYYTGAVVTLTNMLSNSRTGKNVHGCNSYTYGYMLGTSYNSSQVPSYNIVDKISFTDESINNNAITIGGSRHSSTLSSNHKGYSVNSSSTTKNLYTIFFTTDVTQDIGMSLRVLFDNASGVASYLKGYWLSYSMDIPGATTKSTDIECLRFADETVLDIAAFTKSSSEFSSCPALGSTKGYALQLGSPAISEPSGITYDTEAIMSLPGTTLINKAAASVSKYDRVRELKGFVVGGLVVSTTTKEIETVDFSSNTVTLNLYELSVAIKFGIGVYSDTEGFIRGGTNKNDVWYQYTTLIPFLTNIPTQLDSSIRQPISFSAGLSSSDTGFILGGLENVASVAIERLTFNTKSWGYVSNSLSAPRYGSCGIDESTFGFIVGGLVSATYAQNTVEKLDYSDTSIQTISNTLSKPRAYSSSVNGYVVSKGYMFAGLVITPSKVNTNDITSISYVDESTALVSSSLSSLNGHTSVNSVTTGYICGGQANNDLGGTYSVNPVNGVSLFDLQAETLSVSTYSLNTPKAYAVGLSDYENSVSLQGVTTYKGYIAGGNSARFVSRLDGIDFDTISSFIASITLDLHYTGAASFSDIGVMTGSNSRSFSLLDAYDESITTTSDGMPPGHNVENTTGISDYLTQAVFLGEVYSSNTYITRLILLSLETLATQITTINLSSNKKRTVGLSGGNTGVFVGGYTDYGVKYSSNQLESFLFSTLTLSVLGLTIASKPSGASSANDHLNSKSYIYKGCSYSGADTPVNVMDLTTFNHNSTTLSSVSMVLVSNESAINTAGLDSTTHAFFTEKGGNIVIGYEFSTESRQIESMTLMDRGNDASPAAVSFR